MNQFLKSPPPSVGERIKEGGSLILAGLLTSTLTLPRRGGEKSKNNPAMAGCD
jgi:hypothetical protein